jgi:hypothetical protein
MTAETQAYTRAVRTKLRNRATLLLFGRSVYLTFATLEIAPVSLPASSCSAGWPC